MKDGNNGGYANDWLIADRNTGEIASLELGLKHVNLWRTKDGYFAGSNYPIDPALTRDETDFNLNDISNSANARHIRWDQLMAENKGRIDVALGQKFLADHFDTYDKKIEPDERTLCGHIEFIPRGSKPWQPPYRHRRRGGKQSRRRAMAERMSSHRRDGPLLRHRFQSREASEGPPRIRVGKRRTKNLDSHSWTTFRIAN